MKRPPAIGRSHKPRNPGNKPGACTVRTVATFAIRGRVVSWFACPNRTLLTPGWLLPPVTRAVFPCSSIDSLGIYWALVAFSAARTRRCFVYGAVAGFPSDRFRRTDDVRRIDTRWFMNNLVRLGIDWGKSDGIYLLLIIVLFLFTWLIKTIIFTYILAWRDVLRNCRRIHKSI